MRQEKASSKGSADEAIRQEMEDSACMAEMPAEAARCLAKGKAAEAEAAKEERAAAEEAKEERAAAEAKGKAAEAEAAKEERAAAEEAKEEGQGRGSPH